MTNKIEQDQAPISSAVDTSMSFLNMVEGDAFGTAVSKVPHEIWNVSEEEIRDKAKPTKTDYALRIAFWNEFRLASESGQKIQPVRVYTGICTYQHWWANILNCPTKLAWLLQPMKSHEENLAPLLGVIADRYEEIIGMDIHDENGRPVPGLIRLVLQATQAVEGRVLGTPVQKTETKSMNISLRPSDSLQKMSMGEIETRLRELEAQEQEILSNRGGVLGAGDSGTVPRAKLSGATKK